LNLALIALCFVTSWWISTLVKNLN